MNATTRGLRRHLLVLVALVAAAVPTVACDPGTSLTGNAAVTPGNPSPDLSSFYSQKLSWGTCTPFALSDDDKTSFSDPKYDCSYLKVPIDYSQPAARTAQIAVLRLKATAPDQKIGSLLVNPGGPGASGTEAVTGVAKSLTPQLAQRFDLIGFDPRGVGASKPPIQCFTPAERDADRLDVELDNSPAGVARQEGKSKDYANKCAQKSGKDLLANAGTRDVVKDMDVLRQVLGDAKLTYLGYSYGTRIGSAYAEAFPDKVRALVLDGALDPDQNLIDRSVAQAEGFQKSFTAFATSCTRKPGCPLGADVKNANVAFQNLLRPLQTKALAMPGGRQLSYNDAMTGVIQALYSEQLWSALQRGLTELQSGQGRLLMLLADLYEGRNDDGTYAFTLDAFASIGCVDDKPVTDPAIILEADKRARQIAPFRDDGHGPDPARDPCAFWPAPNTSEPHNPVVPGLPPVMVISGTNDPATPYQAGVNLAKALKAKLLTVEDNQHTVALQSVPCVDKYVTDYFIDPTKLPEDGARCKVTPQ
jgi:pimeloyl-ACP methyl ester carboxylesterase